MSAMSPANVGAAASDVDGPIFTVYDHVYSPETGGKTERSPRIKSARAGAAVATIIAATIAHTRKWMNRTARRFPTSPSTYANISSLLFRPSMHAPDVADSADSIKRLCWL